MQVDNSQYSGLATIGSHSTVKKASILLGAVAIFALALIAMTGPSAMAATGYSTYSGSTWNVRSCPATCGLLTIFNDGGYRV